MNSRQLAKKWPFPRLKDFKKILRKATSDWFKEQQTSTHPQMPYCLDKWSNWGSNIILEEVRDYIANQKRICKEKDIPFPLHRWLHHGLSSQAMTFNLIGPLITRNDFVPLLQLLSEKGISVSSGITSASFEYGEREVFNEDSGQPTSIDIVLKNSNDIPLIFIESKLIEEEFGGCSVFSDGDCDGQTPLPDKQRCYLHFIGRRYWELLERFGFEETLGNERQCILAAHYQFFREVLFSLEKGGVFVLLSDERSPVFHCEVNGVQRGLMTFLLTFVPSQYKNRIASISTQEVVRSVKKSNNHQDWVYRFERKYGMA